MQVTRITCCGSNRCSVTTVFLKLIVQVLPRFVVSKDWRRDRVLFLMLATTLSLSVGCYRVRSVSEVYGVYELRRGTESITLELRPDGSFWEKIVYSPQKSEMREGKWFWRADSVNIEALWIPRAFAPDYILTADANSGAGRKFTEPGNWFLHVEKQFGTIVLIVFPDDDVNFRMIRRVSQ